MTRKLNLEAGSVLAKSQDRSLKNLSFKNNDSGNKGGFDNYLNPKKSNIEAKTKFDSNLQKKSADTNHKSKKSHQDFDKNKLSLKEPIKARDSVVKNANDVGSASKTQNPSGSDSASYEQGNKNIANSDIDTEGKIFLSEDRGFEDVITSDDILAEEIDESESLDRALAIDEDLVAGDLMESAKDDVNLDSSNTESQGLDNLPNLWSIQAEHREDPELSADSVLKESIENDSFEEDSVDGDVSEVENSNDSMSEDVVEFDSALTSASVEDIAQDSNAGAGDEDSINPEIGAFESPIEFAKDESKLKSDIDFKGFGLQNVNDNDQQQANIADKDLQEKLSLALLSQKNLSAGAKGENALKASIKIVNESQNQAAKPMDSVISSSANLFFADDGKSDLAAKFFAGLEESRGGKSEMSGENFDAEADISAGKITEISDIDAENSSGDRSFNFKNSAQQINNFGGKIEDALGDKKLTVSFKDNLDNAEGNPKELQQVSMSVKHAITANRSEVKINMHPKALGAVDVTLELTRNEAGEQVVKNIKITAENKQTLEILEKSQIELQKTLSEVKESKDASLEFNMKKQDDEQGNMLYSNSEEREAWMNQFDDSNSENANDSKQPGSGARAGAEKSENSSDSRERALMPGEVDIKV